MTENGGISYLGYVPGSIRINQRDLVLHRYESKLLGITTPLTDDRDSSSVYTPCVC